MIEFFALCVASILLICVAVIAIAGTVYVTRTLHDEVKRNKGK